MEFSLERKNLFNKLFSQFSHDSGILVSFLLNYKSLPKNSCFAIAAGTPHAYIQG
jgi:mannose-6-phosphate isomerase class I